jgi:hypothetical protein
MKKEEWADRGQFQGCQIFLGTIYQSGEECTKMTTKLPNAHKIYPMVVKYYK